MVCLGVEGIVIVIDAFAFFPEGRHVADNFSTVLGIELEAVKFGNLVCNADVRVRGYE